MNWVTVSVLLVLFLGAGSCQEPDEGSAEEDSLEEDSLETNERPYPIKFEMMCPDPKKDEHTLSSNDTEGVPITLEGHCERGQTCVLRLFASPRTFHDAWAYHYTYIDGSSCTYRNWACGQPVRNGNMCAVLCIRTGKWSSLPCTASAPFVCRI